MKTLPLRTLLVVAGVAVAAPSFASVVVPLCGDEKHDEKVKNEEKDKSKTEPKKEANEKKKPVNQG